MMIAAESPCLQPCPGLKLGGPGTRLAGLGTRPDDCRFPVAASVCASSVFTLLQVIFVFESIHRERIIHLWPPQTYSSHSSQLISTTGPSRQHKLSTLATTDSTSRVTSACPESRTATRARLPEPELRKSSSYVTNRWTVIRHHVRRLRPRRVSRPISSLLSRFRFCGGMFC
jgi:hypothetical protein